MLKLKVAWCRVVNGSQIVIKLLKEIASVEPSFEIARARGVSPLNVIISLQIQ
jgi:hypothetical protein